MFLFARNFAWNLLGIGLPLVAAIWTIPILIKGIGTERFGLLAIIWMGVGYFSLFDLGIGRALTKLVAERLTAKGDTRLSSLIDTGIKLMMGLGWLAAAAVALITPWLVKRLLNIPELLVDEALWSFWILAASLPFVVSTAGLVGILQAHQRFLEINVVRIPLGLVTFVAPALLLPLTPSLVAATTAFATARVLAWLTYRWFCAGYVEKSHVRPLFDGAAMRQLLTYGGWITVTNVVGPLMVYFDRFLIGSILSMSAVAYYTTPYEVVTRLWILPEALGGVLFPALAASLAEQSAMAARLFSMAARFLLLSVFLPVAWITLFAPEALTLWLGPQFAQESTPVLRWLAVGVFLNSLARLPFLSLQAYGRPDLVAKLHMLELPLYALVLWTAIKAYGITGAAAAWTLRIAFDTAALFLLGMLQIPLLRIPLQRALSFTVLASMLLLCMLLPVSPTQKVLLIIGITVATVALAFRELAARNNKYGLAVPTC